ncbi:hypothetical protein SK128_011178 [Halocaridina rubra]|uniref:RAD51 interacting motif domain-containing protein n=1 Tax=Halocaridina rubra TaxID=373956 RepID=A0AAN8WZ72_HALRR
MGRHEQDLKVSLESIIKLIIVRAKTNYFIVRNSNFFVVYTMEMTDTKRPRKPVNYAMQGDSDDDFSEFTPPVKKKKDDKDRKSKNNEVENDFSRNTEKDSSSQYREKRHNKERKDDRDRLRMHDEVRERNHIKERDRRHHKERDRYKKDDKDKRKERDHECSDKERSKDRHRYKSIDSSKPSEKQEGSSSQEDTDKDMIDDKCNRKYKQEDLRSTAMDNTLAVDDEDLDFKGGVRSPKYNKSILTSTQISPGRAAPKARLTVEERKFQRELEAALAMSKLGTAGTLYESKRSEPNDKEGQSDEVVNSSAYHDELTFTENFPLAEDEDPIPSTSTGLTHKRQRKKVNFYVDSDSDSFDGFGGSELSEESDFSPSPIKKKGKSAKATNSKTKNEKVMKTKSDAQPKEKVTKTKSDTVSNPANITTTKAKVNLTSAIKENTSPNVLQALASPPRGSATVSPPPLKVSLASVPGKSSPAVKQRSAASSPKATKSSHRAPVTYKTSSSSTSGAGAARAGVGKSPFQSPVIQPNGGSTPNYVPQSPNPIRRIGVRLGLSRINIKPLHPGIKGK